MKNISKAIKCHLSEIKKEKHYTVKETNILAEKALNGSTEAREELIKSNLTMVVCLVKRYSYNNNQFDDAIAAGNQGLIEAVNSYKPGNNFKSWAHTHIKNRIFEFINKHTSTVFTPPNRPGYTYDKIKTEFYANEYDIEEKYKLTDDDGDEDMDDEKLLQLKMLQKGIEILTDEEKSVLILKYYENYSNKEIEIELNMSKQDIKNTLKRSINKIKKNFIKK